MKNKRLTKIVSAFMAAILIGNIASISAFAAEPVPTFTADNLETYNQEMMELGLTESEIQQLQDISTQIATANSMREVDALMKDYHAIMDATPLAAASSFRSYSGGTLTLDYTGSLSPISNVIFTKVVYMSNKQVEFYQKGMNSPTFVTFIKD